MSCPVGSSNKIAQSPRCSRPTEIRVCPQLRSAFGSVTQALDPIMGRFDLDELTGNELLS
jgi:hypothetical protein